jgi:TrmH family RNA methyltransferase
MTDTQTPQGILAVVRQKQYTREDLLGESLLLQDGENSHKIQPCILLLENLQDPGNLGTILRTAEGAGVTGIMMSKDTVDVYNSKVVRATMGAIFRMPFCYEADIHAGVDWLKSQGICCYAAHLNGSSFYEQNYQKPTCFFIGNEGNGLTKELTEHADTKIRIPMMGAVESLNAATAATVLMYEAMRQRTQ